MTYKIDENPAHMQLEVVSYTMHKISKRIIKFELMKMQQIKKTVRCSSQFTASQIIVCALLILYDSNKIPKCFSQRKNATLSVNLRPIKTQKIDRAVKVRNIDVLFAIIDPRH